MAAEAEQQDPNDISQREKEIIAATWKQQGDKTASSQQAAEAAKFLSEVQSKLRDQAISLAGRLQSRDTDPGERGFSAFQKDMNAAAEAMDPAADKLKQQKWHDALPNEQKALQYLLRAEATFRQIQVAFGNQRWRRWWRRRGPRSREPVRSRTRHGKKSV